MKLLLLALLVAASQWVSVAEAGPKRVILDTDPAYDPDDAGCMAMLHGMANEGEVRILAIMNVVEHPESPLAISAINHYYKPQGPPGGGLQGAQEQRSDHHIRSYTRQLGRCLPDLPGRGPDWQGVWNPLRRHVTTGW
jgi:hypothetical protein